MPHRVFRVCRAVFARLDGEGARREGGRWNSPGTPMVYIAESVSLAVLENLVHMSRVDFPSGYVVVGAEIPERVHILGQAELIAAMGPHDTRTLGDLWVRSNLSAVLAVRSTVVGSDHNFILNPRHPQFAQIVAEMPYPFEFDERLFVL